MTFKIKICGLTNESDALAAIDAGADAIGLNFYRGSKRYVTSAEARPIVGAVGNRVDKIGVFVNAPADEICCVCDSVGLQWVQLHGNEPPELLASLGNRFSIVRARRYDERGLPAVSDDISACLKTGGRTLKAVLLDAALAGQFGGTGHALDWRKLENYPASTRGIPLILAGGLTPENVAEAIRIVRPQAVDVASGVESSPGKKDAAKMRDFVAAAQEAFAAL
jgi:phosphoribosylanthranilate isomerase